MSKRSVVCAALALPLLWGVSAGAVPMLSLRLTEGALSQTFGPSASGQITVNQGFGTFFNISATGTGAPNTDPATLIDLSSVEVATATGGTVTIALTETGLTSDTAGGAASFLSAIGGTLGRGNTYRYQTYIDTTNAAFGMQQSLADANFTPTAFSGEFVITANPGSGLFSETETLTLLAVARTVSSFDGQLNEIAEPASIAVLGVALLGVGVVARRRKGAPVS